MNMYRKTFRKEERLCRKRSIDDLFHKGSSFVLYPFRLVFYRASLSDHTELEASDPRFVQVLFTVPKRKIRRASDRNLIKRRMREAYRDLKYERLIRFRDQKQPLHVAIQYLASKPLAYSEIYTRMDEALIKLEKEYAQIYLGESHQESL